MLAKSIFVLKIEVLCPAAASGSFVWPKNWSRSEVGQKVKNVKVLSMGLPIVENLSGLQQSVFRLSRSPQLHVGQKSKKIDRSMGSLVLLL